MIEFCTNYVYISIFNDYILLQVAKVSAEQCFCERVCPEGEESEGCCGPCKPVVSPCFCPRYENPCPPGEKNVTGPPPCRCPQCQPIPGCKCPKAPTTCLAGQQLGSGPAPCNCTECQPIPVCHCPKAPTTCLAGQQLGPGPGPCNCTGCQPIPQCKCPKAPTTCLVGQQLGPGPGPCHCTQCVPVVVTCDCERLCPEGTSPSGCCGCEPILP